MRPGHGSEDSSTGFVPFVEVCIVRNGMEAAVADVSMHEGVVDPFLFQAFYLSGGVGGFQGLYCCVLGGVLDHYCTLCLVQDQTSHML